MNQEQKGENKNGSDVGRGCRAGTGIRKKRRQRHGDSGRENHGNYAGADAGQKGVHPLVFHQICQHRGNQENDEKGRKNDAECCKDGAWNSALRGSDEGCHIDGERSRC